MTHTGGTWYQKHGKTTDPELRLVCFAHAGGVPSFFNGWARHLPASMELVTACYPGRQGRFDEPFAESLAELADQATEALRPYTGTPLAFFGHSMGAVVAHEVALRLDARYGVRPVRLFLSGHPAPHRAPASNLHREDTGTLVAEIKRLGLSSADAMDHPELLELALPMLRSDFRLIETYSPGSAKVRSPIVAYAGDQDQDCRPDAVAAWSELTTAGFEYRAFPGGHFYLEACEADLLLHMAGHLRDDLRLARVVRAAGARRQPAGTAPHAPGLRAGGAR
ncbi:thioesterase II family protein [Kitasatospora sp. NPDC058170]|uniref:thioesterase II family protein n=1 Tax=Kitasatospora sp. NPDC058170 TaxID=3346364 RepID=UPI0036DE23C8